MGNFLAVSIISILSSCPMHRMDCEMHKRARWQANGHDVRRILNMARSRGETLWNDLCIRAVR